MADALGVQVLVLWARHRGERPALTGLPARAFRDLFQRVLRPCAPGIVVPGALAWTLAAGRSPGAARW
ncbi:hypothetical protein ACSNOI_47080 [Actinomadura kijaniata]|uniref:hypothetical protein n=1 Tax=Actinomadura kijaniata TaxID=46161 RepID=UPI003F1D965B